MLALLDSYFWKNVFDRSPYYFRSDNNLLSLQNNMVDELKNVFETELLFYPEMRISKDGQILDIREFSERNKIDSTIMEINGAKTLNLYRRGYTLILQSSQNYLKSSVAVNEYFLRKFVKIMPIEIHSNLYITPNNSQGFSKHFDTHDVFILQIEGSKFWKIWPDMMNKPVGSFRETVFRDYANKKLGDTLPFIETTLEPGQGLYIPRGFIHEGTNLKKSSSTHITVAIKTKTMVDDCVDELNGFIRQNLASFLKADSFSSNSLENVLISYNAKQRI